MLFAMNHVTRPLLVTLVFLTVSSRVYGNPVAPPFVFVDSPFYYFLTGLAAFYGESLLVAWLAQRQRWLRASLIWLLVTIGTFFLFFIVVPAGLEALAIPIRDPVLRVNLLELAVVLTEAFVLWFLWLKQKSFVLALVISILGNALSFLAGLLFWGIQSLL